MAWRRRLNKSFLLRISGLFFFGRKAKKKNARLFPHTIFWSIWCERNRRIFEGVEMLLQCFKDYFIKSLYLWDKGIFCYSSLDLLDFGDSVPMGCV